MTKHPKAEQVYLRLVEVADPTKADQMAAYMKNQFPFLGVQTPTRRDVTKDIIKSVTSEKGIDWDFIDALYEEPYRECHQVALDYLDKVKKRLSPDDFSHLLSLAKSHQWWDSIDRLDRLFGQIALVDKGINEKLLSFAVDPDFWIRRIAIDHQIGRKQATDADLLAQIICLNFGSSEFFINKAIGWSLREYGKTNPKWVGDFVDQHKDQMANLSIREAIRNLPQSM